MNEEDAYAWLLVARNLPGRFPAEAEAHKKRMAELDAEIHRLKLALMGLGVDEEIDRRRGG